MDQRHEWCGPTPSVACKTVAIGHKRWCRKGLSAPEGFAPRAVLPRGLMIRLRATARPVFWGMAEPRAVLRSPRAVSWGMGVRMSAAP